MERSEIRGRWSRITLTLHAGYYLNRREPLAVGGELFQQRRRAQAVIAGPVRELSKAVAAAGETDAVGVVHGTAAMGGKAIAIDPNHVDIAGASRDPLGENARAFIDHRKQQPLYDLVLADRHGRRAAPCHLRRDQPRDLGIGLRRARGRRVEIEAAAGLLAKAAALAQEV